MELKTTVDPVFEWVWRHQIENNRKLDIDLTWMNNIIFTQVPKSESSWDVTFQWWMEEPLILKNNSRWNLFHSPYLCIESDWSIKISQQNRINSPHSFPILLSSKKWPQSKNIFQFCTQQKASKKKSQSQKIIFLFTTNNWTTQHNLFLRVSIFFRSSEFFSSVFVVFCGFSTCWYNTIELLS